MNNYLSRKMIIYLLDEIGLDESSIELGLKLSIKNKTTFEELVDKSSITLSLPNQKSLKFCPDEIETLK